MNTDAARGAFGAAAAWTALAAAAFLVWYLRAAFLLVFAAILVAILLNVLASAICRITKMSQGAALLLATLLAIGLVLLTFWLFGRNLSAEFAAVSKTAEAGIAELQGALERYGMSGADLGKGAAFLGSAIPALLSSSIQGIEIAILVLVTAIYLAADPGMYRTGAAMLVPNRFRSAAVEALGLIGNSLRLWMMAQLLIMVVVGLLSFAAVKLIGLPNAIALGVIAGLTEIVPYLGPFIGAVPAVLEALTQGLVPALWTMAAYLGVHMIEGYVISPLLQHRFAQLPPALVLTGIFAMQLLFGPVGVVVAAPMTVAIFAAVKVLYLRNTLKQPTEMPKEPPL